MSPSMLTLVGLLASLACTSSAKRSFMVENEAGLTNVYEQVTPTSGRRLLYSIRDTGTKADVSADATFVVIRYLDTNQLPDADLGRRLFSIYRGPRLVRAIAVRDVLDHVPQYEDVGFTWGVFVGIREDATFLVESALGERIAFELSTGLPRYRTKTTSLSEH